MARNTTILTCIAIACMAISANADDRAATFDGLSEEAARLVRHLDALDWKTRDQATFDLMNADPDLIDDLRRKSQSGVTTETALRLKRAAEELFFSKRIGDAPACLGIGHTIAIRWDEDPRVAPGVHAIRINVVYKNTPAARAGLRPGDLIIGTNGNIAESKQACVEFAGWISSQAPGTLCEFNVLRDINGRVLPAGPGIDRRGFRNLETRVIQGSNDVRLPHESVGLLITNARRADPRLGLEPGDLIVAIDGQSLPSDGPKQALANWADAKTPSVDPEAEMRRDPRMPIARRSRQMKMIPSIQILRGGRRIDLKATLGRWPLDLAEKNSLINRGARLERIVELRGEFDRWWNLPADAESTTGVTARNPSLFWQMEG